MKSSVGKIALATMLTLWSAPGTASDGWPLASDYLLMPRDCAAAGAPATCKDSKERWERNYSEAIAGGYQGQRNVAYCLSTGCDIPEFRKNPILGCAWRVVIVNSGHLAADEMDGKSLQLYCGSQYLDDTGRVMADAQARTILQKLGIAVLLK